MGEREGVNLIFLPGFSTADKVTNVSGRGVGMDVVKTNIEKIGGTVDVQSQIRQGTTVRMKIPLTLAIIPALIVTSGGDRYAIPQVSLLELVRLDGEARAKGDRDSFKAFPCIACAAASCRWFTSIASSRSRRSARSLEATRRQHRRAPGRRASVRPGRRRNQRHRRDRRQAAWQAAQRNDTFAGATIMGDGRVALILDVLGLAQTPTSSVKFASARSPTKTGTWHRSRASVKPCSSSSAAPTAAWPWISPSSRVSKNSNPKWSSALATRRSCTSRASYAAAALSYPQPQRPWPLQRKRQARSRRYAASRRLLRARPQRRVLVVDLGRLHLLNNHRAAAALLAVTQQRVTDLLDVRGFLRTANPNFFESAAPGGGFFL